MDSMSEISEKNRVQQSRFMPHVHQNSDHFSGHEQMRAMLMRSVLRNRPRFTTTSKVDSSSSFSSFSSSSTKNSQIAATLPKDQWWTEDYDRVSGGSSTILDPTLVSNFQDKFHVLVKDLEADVEGIGGSLPQVTTQWISRLSSEALTGGKGFRGATVSLVARTLTGGVPDDALVLGWAIEWLQGGFLVADDMMDGSETRRGSPAWYRQTQDLPGGVKEVGTIAVNDALLLLSQVHRIIALQFHDRPALQTQLDKLFLEVRYKTELGQLVDVLTAERETSSCTEFSWSEWEAIVEYKTAYYTFFLPVASALILADKGSEEALTEAKDACLALGSYFQATDDFLDCFGHPDTTGKIGTDIADNKASWLIVKAVELARSSSDPGILETLTQFYGRAGEEAEGKVRAVYKELGVAEAFLDYEQRFHASWEARMTSLTVLDRSTFDPLFKMIYKRAK